MTGTLRVIPAALAVANLMIVAAAATGDPPGGLDQLNAHEAVHTGNRLLGEGDPDGALEAYGRAEGLEPAAREIPFVQGLAHFARGAYEQARQTFEKAAASKSDALADDAEYGLGTTYHAQALENLDNPEAAISHFESAMQRYHNVLANRPDHHAAREANLKAATMWRQVKELLEQQQQEQENQDGENNEQRQEQQQQQDEGDQQEQKEPQSSRQEQDQQKEDQQPQTDPSQDQENEQPRQAQPQRQEQDLREQAQRRLREMMQAIRQRKKARREQQVQATPVAPVDKDW